MKDDTTIEVANAQVFDIGHTLFLSDVIAQVTAGLDGSQRRDTFSAFNALEKHAGVDLTTTPANATSLRPILASMNASNLDISPKRLANIRSLISQAVARFGMQRRWITKDIELAPEWYALMGLVPKREYRWSLSRLACYCSVVGIVPTDVFPQTLLGLHAALEADCTVTKPRGILKQTISIWNMCLKTVADWPQQKLSSPFKKQPFMFKLADFPETFQHDVGAWTTRMSNPDPLDPDAPLRASREVTLEGYILTFRRLGSALVRGEHMTLAEVTSLSVLSEIENLKNALRHFIDKAKGDNLDYPGKMATQMAAVAKYHLKLDDKTLGKIEVIKRQLGKQRGPIMGKRNRDRLKQFDDPDAVQRVLHYPALENVRGLQKKQPMRRAKCVERALIVSILIFAGVRAQNLRTLHLIDNIRRAKDRVFLEFAAHETKTHAEHTVELPREAIDLLDNFVKNHRPLLPGSDGPYLFPAPDGGPRHYSSIRTVISKNLMDETGIQMSPHLFRHFVAKIVAEQQPELLPDVSRRLGHKSFNTTYQSYLGTETPAASRRINAMLAEVNGQPLKKNTSGGKPS
jgi:integrase